MISITTALLSAIGLLFYVLLVKRHLKRIRLITLGSCWESVVWSYRVTVFKHAFLNELKHWGTSCTSPQQIEDIWELLRPFFVSKGYIIYKQNLHYAESFPCSVPAIAPDSLRHYPYARTLDNDKKFGLIMGSHYVWGARDSLNRDVIIKVISEVDKPSNEWLILQKFNHPSFRNDPRNQTIHVIEYITFANFVFAVMPRWDPAFVSPFSTVAELMDITKSYLDALDFLHSHRVAHQDLSLGNVGMNLYGNSNYLAVATGVREPRDVKYTLYDFGHSLIYPTGTNIDTVKTSRRLSYYHAPDPSGAYNPFKSDVAMMGGLLHGHVMHVSKVVPDIEAFFYRMMDLEENKRPTASEALQEFMRLYDSLTVEQLRTPVVCIWTNRVASKLSSA